MKHNNNKGITLMVLVIMIIILLILSGVTISMITGGNGIINRTIQAVEQTEIAQAIEELQMLYLENIMDTINENYTTEEQMKSYLDYLEENDIPTKEEDGSYYVEVDGKIYEIEIDDDGNLNIEYVEDGEITEPRIKSVTVTDQTEDTVTIEVTAIRMEGGTYYYYIGTDEDDLNLEGNNTTGEYTFEDLEEGTYYIKVVAESAEGLTAEKTITVNIEEDKDIIPPTITKAKITETTTCTITVSVEAKDSESGIAKYKYYIAESADDLETKAAYTIDTTSDKTSEVTIDKLTQGTEYWVKVVVVDNAGNETTSETLYTKTEEIPSAETAVTRTVEWNASSDPTTATATVTLETTTDFDILYSLDGETWYDYNDTPQEVTNGDSIWICLTDGYQNGTSYKLVVSDTEGPEVKATMTSTTKTITVTTEASDEGSGVDESSYTYYIADTEADLDSASEETDTQTHTFKYLTQNSTYWIKIEVKDKIGNKTEYIKDVDTQKIPDAETAVTRTISWNESSDPNTATATVTLAKTEEAEDFSILYSTDGGSTWHDYAGTPLSATNGNSIWICLTDDYQNGLEYVLNVTDFTGPNIEFTEESKTASTVKISVKATDTGAGMSDTATYSYYIKLASASDDDYASGEEGTTSTSCEFTGLTALTDYTILVKTTDKIGNETEETYTFTTSNFTYTEGNIAFSGISWSNKKASVNIYNNTTYTMEYKVFESSASADLTDNTGWTTATSNPEPLSGLVTGNYIVARLTDGTNTTTGYAALTITDTTKPTVAVLVTVGDGSEVKDVDYTKWDTTTYVNEDVTLTIVASDDESGLTDTPYTFDGKTWSSVSTATYEENTSGIVIQVIDEAGNKAEYGTIDITNIDKNGPSIGLATSTTMETATVTVTATDTGSGVDEDSYEYYIAEKYDDLSSATKASDADGSEYTFTGLSQETDYWIKVVVKDKLGNESTSYEQVTTGALDVDLSYLTITEPEWENKSATVTITNELYGSYYMQYQVVKSGTNFDKTTGWSDYIEVEETEVTGLKNGDKVYAWLTNKTNTSSTVIQSITDTTAPTVAVLVTVGDGSEVKDVDYQSWDKDTYVNEDVTLTIDASDNESGLTDTPYTFDGSTWQAEDSETYTENTSGIVIQVIDEAENKAEYGTINITNIDKDGPNIVLTTSDTTTNKTTVKVVSATDDAAGMSDTKYYTYSIKEGTSGTYKTISTNNESDEYTFENLTAGATYYIKVETQDKLGNTSSEEISVTTTSLTYAIGDIIFTDSIWSNGIATVTETAATENAQTYTMQYQIGRQGASMVTTASEWTNVDGDTINIGTLEDGDKIYARLTDGYNVTVGYAECDIINPAKESYTEEDLASDTTRSDYDILGISVSSTEIRVQINEEQDDASLYTYYYKTVNDDEYTLISTCTYADDPAVITDITENATYKIKVLVIDSNKNVTRCENTATVIAAEQIEAGETDTTDNRTYIDNSTELAVRTTAGTGSAGDGTTVKLDAGYTITVPATFSISSTSGETEQSEGVVLTDSSSNEYVWIPVNDAIYDEATAMPTSAATAERTYKPMASKQSEGKYQSIIYTYNGKNSYKNTGTVGIGTTGYREPDIITASSLYDASSSNYSTVLGFSSSDEFSEYIQSSYDNMVTAVDTFGGFYVGRYETTTTTNGGTVVGSKANTTILSTLNWYYLYLYQDSTKYASNPYYNVDSVTSSMIWGSQWDAMLNWLLTGTDSSKVATKTGSQPNEQVASGTDSTDKMGNIYDLGSNAYEWTQEAYSTSYRVYRGGSYNSTTSSTAATRGYVVSTDLGPVFGTRMALYVQSTTDVTGPSVKINDKTSTSNTITVEATATDKETGVSKYEYYIGTENGVYTYDGESTSGTYTYKGLKQTTTYYIKVVAIDGNNNEGYATDYIDTETLGEVATSAISLTQLYGSDGSGIAQLTLADTYSESGYYIQYVLVDEANIGTFTMDSASWLDYDSMISGLSNGVYICASVYDGTNRSSDYFSEQVTGLEEYAYIDASGGTYATKTLAEAAEAQGTKTSLSYTIKYSDGTDTATIPAGFQVGITSTVNVINNGLVIQDEAGNQYVWVPVETAVETETSKTSSEKAMARYQSGYSSGSSPAYYEGILYDFSETTSTKKTSSVVVGVSGTYYREPSLVTRGADYTWKISLNSATGTSYDTLEQYYKKMNFGTTSSIDAFDSYTEFGQYMNQEYTNMINSVNKYGGFYVGRFETSISASSTSGVVKSQISQTLTTSQNWYKWYYWQDSNLDTYNPYNSENTSNTNNSTNSVTSSMIWGSQWDAMLNWMLEDDTTNSFVTSVTGNREGSIAKTGTYPSDKAKNIFDLSGNTMEMTQEAYSMYYREIRGGSYLASNTSYGEYSAKTRTNREPTETAMYYTIGTTQYSTSPLTSRMALYINNTEDDSAPNAEIESTSSGTNNVGVNVTATDDESGISKYIYSISNFDFNSSSFNEATDVISTVTTYGSSYTFSGLTQNSTYYVRVEVVNGAGLTTTVYGDTSIQTATLTVEEGTINLDKTWGKDTDGTQYYTIKEGTSYADEGYKIQYQVVQDADDFDEYGKWSDGDTVTGLSVGDIVYVRLYDEVNYNEGESYTVGTITELEEYTEAYTATEKYEDGNDATAYIPAGFKRGSSSLNNTIANGLVIEDEYGNQYVWIPVEQAVETTADATTNSTVKSMARYQSGSTTYYEGISYNFSGTTSTKQSTSTRVGTSTSYREPSLITNSSKNLSWVYESGGDYDASKTYYGTLSELGITSASTFGEYMNEEYTAMIESVIEYGGFYVGRYETTLYTAQTGGSYNISSGTAVKSIAGANPMSGTGVNWYKMYLVQDSHYSGNPYYSSSSVVSSMIWGSQWDAMLNYILTGSDAEDVTAITGNHTGSRAVTASFGNDLMNNIFDLSSNIRDWTQEAYSYSSRARRGGYYNTTSTGTAAYRYSYDVPTNTHTDIGSRLALYLK